MIKFIRICFSVSLIFSIITFSPAALSAGDLARKVTRLEPLVLGTGEEDDFVISREEIKLETGRLYMLPLEAKGYKEYRFEAPEFFQNIWVHQVVIEDLEVHTRRVDALEFDDQGTIEFWFVAIRPGEFEWFIDGFESKGMVGKIIVE